MRLLIARLLLRLRGPMDACVWSADGLAVEGDIVFICRHRRYVTVWSVQWEREWDESGNKHFYPELTVTSIPWRKVDEVSVTYGGRG
jgi:hypothetical protein